GRYISGTSIYGSFVGDGSGLTGVTAGSSDRIVSGTTAVYANNNTGYVSFTSAGNTTGWYSPGGIFAAVGISTTSNQASFTTVYASGQMSIGTTTFGGGSNLIIGRTDTAYEGGQLGLTRSNDNSQAWGLDVWGAGNDTIFRVINLASSTAPFIIANNDFVGIGTLSPTAKLEVNGTVSATNFVGDGSGLTNLSVSGDRITSGTTTALVNSATTYISLSTGATTWGYLSSATSYLPTLTAALVSSTVNGTVSATYGNFRYLSATTLNVSGTAYVSDLIVMGSAGGAGMNLSTDWYDITNVPTVLQNISNSTGSVTVSTIAANTVSTNMVNATGPTGTVSGTYGYFRYISGTAINGTFTGDGSGLTGVTAGSSDRIVSGTTAVYANNNTGYVSFTSAGNTTGWYSPAGIFAAVGISTTSNQASFTTVYAVGLATLTNGISLTGNLTGATLISTTSGGTVSATNVNGNTATFNTLTANSIGAGNINASGQITATAVGANLISATAATGTVSATYGYFKYISATNGLSVNLSETIAINDLKDASSTVASGNMFLGSGGGNAIDGGLYNTTVGIGTGANMTSGNSNVALGYQALNAAGSASGNVAIGYRALADMSYDFDNSIAIGNQAASGSNEDVIAVGYQAAYNNSGSQVIAIGQNAAFENIQNNLVVMGKEAGYQNQGYGLMAIGQNAGKANSGSGGMFIGDSAGQNNTGSSVMGIGSQALMGNTGSGNMAVGSNAGKNNTGSGIMMFGNNAGTENAGFGNLLVGEYAGYQNTGSGVSAFGGNAASSNSGNSLVAVGNGAASNNYGSNITAIGNSAAGSNLSDELTALGYYAGNANSGTTVTAVGTNAGKNNIYSNVTLLGANTSATANNQVVLGDTAITVVSTSGVYNGAGLSATGITGTVSATYGYFKYISATNGLGGGGSGDRITSGTTNAIANSATTYISLTTGATTWGYLSSGTSYIPTLTAALVSTTSGGTVSATYGNFRYLSATTLNVSGTAYVSDLIVMGTATGAGLDPVISISSSAAGANTQIQFNDNGELGASSGLTYTSGTGVLFTGTISTTSAYLTTISTSLVKLNSPTAIGCTSGDYGTMRYNGTSGKPQICLNR
ncbi:MAG TPA: hypothetical protein VHP58_04530, partial [Alphaproteobacteria bacterium]|nr:hypothetical protein [Alphaproteobacteria bacterium]